MWEPEHQGMTAAPKLHSLLELHRRDCPMSRTSRGSQEPAKTHRPRGTGGGGTILVRRMSQDERRRSGTAGPGGVDSTPEGVAPLTGEGALGRWRAPNRQQRPDAEPGYGVNLNGCRAGGITTHSRGVCVREIKPRDVWEGPSGKAAAANRTREIRPSGMRGEHTETWTGREDCLNHPLCQYK